VGGALADRWGVRLPLYIAGIAQCAAAIALAGPLTRSLAASERATAMAEAEPGLSAPANGNKPLTNPPSGGQAHSPTLELERPRAPTGRRLHSRPGHGPFYWGRSSRNWRR